MSENQIVLAGFLAIFLALLWLNALRSRSRERSLQRSYIKRLNLILSELLQAQIFIHDLSEDPNTPFSSVVFGVEEGVVGANVRVGTKQFIFAVPPVAELMTEILELTTRLLKDRT